MSDVGPGLQGPARSRRGDFLISAGIVLVVVGAVAGPSWARCHAQRPSRAQCVALLDRWVEHSIRAREPEVKPEVVTDRLRRLIDNERRSTNLSLCERELAVAEVECALDAPNVDELERCLQ